MVSGPFRFRGVVPFVPYIFKESSGFRAHRFQMKIIRRFLADESGATAIEYGLIAAGIALAIIAVVNGLGSKLNTKFTSVNTSLK
jgi:pilus assembly protein Flp/PilA